MKISKSSLPYKQSCYWERVNWFYSKYILKQWVHIDFQEDIRRRMNLNFVFIYSKKAFFLLFDYSITEITKGIINRILFLKNNNS